jgi:uncharacterized small protein (DUF1192 family)
MPELTVKAALEGLQQELRQAEDLKQHERVAEIKTRIRQLKRAVNRVEKAERKKKPKSRTPSAPATKFLNFPERIRRKFLKACTASFQGMTGFDGWPRNYVQCRSWQ